MRGLLVAILILGACDAKKEAADESGTLPVLPKGDATDPVRLRELGDALGLEPVEFEEVVRSRGARDETQVWVLYPRDNVRPEDLVDYRVDVGAEFDAPGTLEFRRGTTVLFAAPFQPAAVSSTAPIPAAVRDAFGEKGGTVTWGFFPEKGKAVTAKFTVVRNDSSLDRRIASLRKRLEGQPPVVQEQLLAQLFLNKGYYVAALRHARAALAIMKDCPQAVAILQGAVQRLDLKDTPLWDEVTALVDAVPPERKSRLARPDGPGRAR